MKFNVFLVSAIALLALSLIPIFASAQQEISAAGGNTESQLGSISYTIGQPVAVTIPCYTVGVQQVFSIEQISIDGVEGYGDAVKIFPNPTVGYIVIASSYNQEISYNLLNVNGVIVHSGTVMEQQQIDLSSKPAGVYILTITDGKQKVTYRIVKQ